MNPTILSRVFSYFLYVKRPQLPLFTPCFRLYYRTVVLRFLSPLRFRFTTTTTYCAFVSFAADSQMDRSATYRYIFLSFSYALPHRLSFLLIHFGS